MDCREFQNLWPEALEETLSPDRRGEWEAHRQTCGACRKEVEALEDLQHQLKGIPPATPLPPVFWSRQRGAIRARIDRTPRRLWKRFWESVLQPRLAVAAAMAALLLFFGYQFWGEKIFTDKRMNQVAFRLEDWEEIAGEEEDWELDEPTANGYYAYLAQRYLPTETEDWEEDDAIENLNSEELDGLIRHFEQTTSRRTL